MEKEILDLNKKELGYLLGVYLGDGYSYSDKVICLEAKDLDFVEEFKRNCLALDLNCPTRKRLNRNLFIASTCSKSLFSILESFILDRNKIIELSNEQKIMFLKAIFDSEGTIYQHPDKSVFLAIYNTDEKLLATTKTILESFKFSPVIKKQKVSKGHFGKKQLFILSISTRKDIIRFGGLIGFSIRRKQEKLEKIIAYHKNKILKPHYFEINALRNSGLTFAEIGQKINQPRGNAWNYYKIAEKNLNLAKEVGFL